MGFGSNQLARSSPARMAWGSGVRVGAGLAFTALLCGGAHAFANAILAAPQLVLALLDGGRYSSAPHIWSEAARTRRGGDRAAHEEQRRHGQDEHQPAREKKADRRAARVASAAGQEFRLVAGLPDVRAGTFEVAQGTVELTLEQAIEAASGVRIHLQEETLKELDVSESLAERAARRARRVRLASISRQAASRPRESGVGDPKPPAA